MFCGVMTWVGTPPITWSLMSTGQILSHSCLARAVYSSVRLRRTSSGSGGPWSGAAQRFLRLRAQVLGDWNHAGYVGCPFLVDVAGVPLGRFRRCGRLERGL